MKNTLNFFAISTLTILLSVSCSKKGTNEDITSLPYATESVSAGKTDLQNSGQQMVTELSSLADAQGITASQNLSDCLDKSNPFSSSAQSAVIFTAMKTAKNYGTSKDVKGIINFLSTSAQNTSDSTLKQIFSRYSGIYTWSTANNTSQWIKTAATGKIELLFPSTKGGTTNDAKLDFTYQSKTATSSITGINGDLPLLFDAVLAVNTDKILEYSFTAQYDNTGIPINVTTFLALYPFKFEVTANKTSSLGSLRYLFTDGTKTIFDLYGEVDGNLSQTSIDNSASAEEIVSNANAYFQLFNIKLAGRIDITNLSNTIAKIEGTSYPIDSTQNVAEVAAYNKYVALVLMYADTKQKIAQAEFYPVTQIDSYYDYYDNQTYSDTYYSNDVRFIFTDGSKGDLKTYFGDGFKAVINDFNTLLVKLNTNFNLGASPVTYTGK